MPNAAKLLRGVDRAPGIRRGRVSDGLGESPLRVPKTQSIFHPRVNNETLSVAAVCVGSCQGRIPCFKRIIFWGNDCVGPAVRRGGFYLKPVLIFIDRIGLVPVEFPAPASHLIFPHHHARCRTSRTWFYDDASNVIETHQHFGNFKEWFCSVTACRILTCY